MVPVGAMRATTTIVEAREASDPSAVKPATMKSAKSAMKPAAVESTTAVKTPASAMRASIGEV